jgi:hypothetical protein
MQYVFELIYWYSDYFIALICVLQVFRRMIT